MTSKRKNIIQPTLLWRLIAEQMGRDGESNLSRWIGDCAIDRLDPDLREQVPDRPVSGNPNFTSKVKH